MPHWDSLDHACAERRHAAGSFTLPGAERHYPPDLELEPVHLAIALQVDLEAQACDGTVTVTVEAQRAGPTELVLDGVAFEELAVREADGRALSWRYDGQKITIDWAEPFGLGERRRVEVGYRVEKPTSGLYFSKPGPEYPDQPWFAATDHETERARHWLACVDLPSARPRLDFFLRADARWTILANGQLVDETHHGDGTKTAHWQLDYPCPSYLTCFVIGDLVRADDGDFEGIPVAYFAPPPHTVEELHRTFGRTREMLAWMTAKLELPFPFPKYFQFALPGFGGAMENISLVSWGDGYVLDETLAREWTRLIDEVNVHELAHSYFGDAVVCRDYAHAWLKESWATYLEQVWFEDTRGRDEQLYQYFRDAQGYFGEADNRYKRPIVTREFNSSWDMYDRHLYPGGACRLHTLRCELGDETFWPAVRDYLRRYAGHVVETDDFRRVLEQHSGRSLGKLFDQWFFMPGYPSLKVTFRYDAKRQEGTFEIEQTQVDAAAGIPVFELSTDVGWVIDGRQHTQPVRLTEARHTVVVPMATEPQAVRFDPLAKVLHKLELNPGDAMLRHQLVAAPDILGRIQAGAELAKTGRRKNIEAIHDACRAEPFWGVRVELAKALGGAGAEAAIEALAELIAWERDPMVIEPLLRAATTYRDARIRAAVAARLQDGLPYRATQAAYELLGAQRDEAPFELLAAAAATPGFGGVAQAGALRALAATRREEALPLLIGHSRYGRIPRPARPAAVAALAELGRVKERGLREQAVDRLVDLLRDPERAVQMAAVSGLKALGAREATAALEAFRGPLADQEQVHINRILHDMRQEESPKVIALEAQIEELHEKLRKLRDTVDHLQARVDSDANGAAGGGDGAGTAG
jgi:aminopeptidase N